MKIKRLRIRRMPGFPDGGPSYNDLADGLNVIVGPNASGKTTTCQAIRGLLWEGHLAGSRPVSIESTWTDGEQTILIDLEADHRTCQRDGVSYDGPALPPSDLARCFTVTIDDLFEIKDTDRAERIVNALAGGYNLRAVRDELTGFSTARARNAQKAVQQARRNARDISREHEQLRREEESQAELRAQATRAAAAAARLARLQDARDIARLRGEITAVRAALSSFPKGMEHLRGDEADRLAQLRDDIDAHAEKLADAERQADHAAQRQADADLPDGGIPAVRLDEQQDHLTALDAAERDLAAARKTVRQAGTKRDEALGRLGAIGQGERIAAIDTAGLDEFETFHREFEANYSERAAVEARLDLIGPDEPAGDVEGLAQATGILREWLEGGPADDTAARRNAGLVMVLAALLAVVGITFAVIVSAWWAALIAPAAAGVVVARSGGLQPKGDRRAERQAAFGRTDLEPPAAWTADAVGRRIAELEQALAVARQAMQRSGERRSLQHRLDRLTDEAQPLEARRAKLAEQLGVATGSGALALVDLAANLRAHHEAAAALEAAEAEAAAGDRLRCERLEKISAFLAEFGIEACETCDVARTRVRALQRRAQQYADAKVALGAARRAGDEARHTAGKLQDRKRDLFQAAGLDDDDKDALNDRLGRLQAYRDARTELAQLETQRAALEARLVDADDLAAMTAEQIEAEALRLEALAADHEELVGRIKEIELRVRQAGAGHRVEDALAAVEQAEAEVADHRAAALRAEAGAFLLDDIEAKYRAEREPDVLRRARDWFARFTQYRYELRAEGDGEGGRPSFRAVETTTRRGLGLDELSRGTRMQLLLAVRLAFAAEAETGTQLPFILDEVLSSSDPERYEAIVECLLVLVREGRQVFYFTCQPGDAKAWREAAEAAGIDQARLIPLGDAQRSGAAAGPLSESTIRTREVPAPDGAALGEYARMLGAALLNPAVPAAGAHLGHFADDAEQLHRLVRAGIETVGQLRSLADHGQSDAYIAADALARILARADLLDAFADAWSVGRGRPLTREDLTAAGVSEKYIDGMTEMARERNWNAERLMNAVEARDDERLKRLSKKKIEEMRDWMRGTGHLSAEETLDEQVVRNRVLAAANDHIKAGTLTIDQVGSLFATWWQMCIMGDTASASCAETG